MTAAAHQRRIGGWLLFLPRIALALYLNLNAVVGPIWLSLAWTDGTTTKGLSDPSSFYWAWIALAALTFISCGIAGTCLFFWSASARRGFIFALALLFFWPLIIGLAFKSEVFWATLGKLMFISHLWILQVFHQLLT